MDAQEGGDSPDPGTAGSPNRPGPPAVSLPAGRCSPAWEGPCERDPGRRGSRGRVEVPLVLERVEPPAPGGGRTSVTSSTTRSRGGGGCAFLGTHPVLRERRRGGKGRGGDSGTSWRSLPGAVHDVVALGPVPPHRRLSRTTVLSPLRPGPSGPSQSPSAAGRFSTTSSAPPGPGRSGAAGTCSPVPEGSVPLRSDWTSCRARRRNGQATATSPSGTAAVVSPPPPRGTGAGGEGRMLSVFVVVVAAAGRGGRGGRDRRGAGSCRAA